MCFGVLLTPYNGKNHLLKKYNNFFIVGKFWDTLIARSIIPNLCLGTKYLRPKCAWHQNLAYLHYQSVIVGIRLHWILRLSGSTWVSMPGSKKIATSLNVFKLRYLNRTMLMNFLELNLVLLGTNNPKNADKLKSAWHFRIGQGVPGHAVSVCP